MSPELVLSIISVGIAIADFTYSIYESSHTIRVVKIYKHYVSKYSDWR